ncbi:hypothetical protein [Aquisalimonas asiatica]|uniref:Uncharacterized protein n=1 Tax=Aquisalimonas asiatica TaxID=406100 RepID=A0A1H8TMQ2_9GAMM|nr:hypothetical protein [Aquisalimonas asiatica]SEO92329.1 hypothetical protein SAMN04488052_104331 [Aquisalimonas asiatica]
MRTFHDWRHHYGLSDNADSRREYSEYCEALQALQAASERTGVDHD